MDAVTACPAPGDVRYHLQVWRPGGGGWESAGALCLGPSDFSDGPGLDVLVREEVEKRLPDAKPSYQPVRGAIVNLPTLFASGEPSYFESEPFDVTGFTIVVTATPTWEWTFEPGVTEHFSKPGGPYPDDSVAHTYTQQSTHQVTVTTTWDAEYTVNGEGPFPVEGEPLTKTAAPLTVEVREARSVLVAE